MPLDIVDQLDRTGILCLFPVNAVTATLSRHLVGKCPEGLFPLFTPGFSVRCCFIQTVAAQTSLQVVLGEIVAAGGKEFFATIEGRFAVVTGAAEVALHVVSSPDAAFVCFHRKADVNMADPAGKGFSMDPVLEKYRINPGL